MTTVNEAKTSLANIIPMLDSENNNRKQEWMNRWVMNDIESERSRIQNSATRMIEDLQKLVRDLASDDISYFGPMGTNELSTKAVEIDVAVTALQAKLKMIEQIYGLSK